MPASLRPRGLPYLIALLSTAGAAGLTALLPPLQESSTVLYAAAVVIAAWFGGLRPGLFASVLSIIALNALPPGPEFTAAASVLNLVRLLAFVLVSILVGRLHVRRRQALVAQAQDSAARQDAEAALRTANERLRTTLESITEAYVAFDYQFCFLEVNPAAQQLIFQRPPDELIGKKFLELYPEAIGTELYEQCLRAIETCEPVHFEGRSKIASRWFEAHAYPRGGRLEVYLHDITDRKAAEERTTQLQELTAALSSAVTQQQVAEVISRRAMHALGGGVGLVFRLVDDRSAVELIGHSDLPPEIQQRFRRMPVQEEASVIADVVLTGRPIWIASYEEHLQRYPGMAQTVADPLDTQALAAAPLVVGGEVIGAIGVNFTRSRRLSEEDQSFLVAVAGLCAQALDRARLYDLERRARRSAEEADQLKVRFLAMVSHELRNPLTSIKGFASTLLADDVAWEPSVQREFIEMIDDEADRLAELVEQLLDLSRMSAGHFSIHVEPTTPRELVDATRVQLALLTARHELIVNVPADLPPVQADTRRIAQVLTNLVGNAVKFSPAGTRIQIAARAEDSYVTFMVHDEGPGIPPEHRDRVFEAFRQIGSDGEPAAKGAGLGLAIARGLVEAHSGRIWAADSPDPGATICFTLPASPGPGTHHSTT